ncbi:MAG TPA: L-threonylcarbamoyladenylate synthase [Polyangiales bacterium]|nr:L-threonylcarbamoyladenylate synthase [Polyangiales bacterium]
MQIHVNAKHPEPRKIAHAIAALEKGEVIAYPTDTVYGLGCDILSRRGVEALYRMKNMRNDQLLSFVCPDLSDIARYAIVGDAAYRVMRRLLPGPYTFILAATKEVPRALRMKRKTVGVRVPSHPVTLALTRALGRPLVSTSAAYEGEYLIDPGEIEDRFPGIALVMDAEGVGLTPSTVIDLSGDEPVVVREGAGPVDFV